jgi:K+-sensing histidine kinase KdpD
MGLRISRSIVESHGGRMWAAANSPHGASFYFTLPANSQVPSMTAMGDHPLRPIKQMAPGGS